MTTNTKPAPSTMTDDQLEAELLALEAAAEAKLAAVKPAPKPAAPALKPAALVSPAAPVAVKPAAKPAPKPTPSVAPAAAPAKAPAPKPAAPGAEVVTALFKAAGESIGAKSASATPAPSVAPPAAPVPAKAPKAPPAPPAAADFLMFVGGSFGYTKEAFITEAAALGISKRLPSFRLPAALKPGVSKVWLAAAGSRGPGAKPTSIIFGYFIPDAIEFIDGADGAGTYADVIAALKKVDGVKVVTQEVVKKEAKRLCGYRKEGGTYLVSKTAPGAATAVSPLVIQAGGDFKGNHFRGMMELDTDQSIAVASGKGLDVLISETCMGCLKGFFCSPDGHLRANRERARLATGAAMKWKLLCPACNTAAAVAKAKATREAKKPLPPVAPATPVS